MNGVESIPSGDTKLRFALRDIWQGVLHAPIWSMLGWQEIRQRYRRSLLGPFWLTLSMGALIGGMGPLYGKLFGQPLGEYFPHLAIGFVVWALISSLVLDSTQVFIGAEQYLKQIKLPLTVHVLRMVWRNAVIFAHNSLIVVVVMFLFVPRWSWWAPLAFLGLGAILVNGIWIGLLLGLVCARYRDIGQIVASVVQIGFFLTPVMWKPETLGRQQWAADFNPLYHMIEVVRAPLLGGGPALTHWMVVLLVTFCGFAFSIAMFSRYRARIAYWV